jgi:hypothetical protein
MVARESFFFWHVFELQNYSLGRANLSAFFGKAFAFLWELDLLSNPS